MEEHCLKSSFLEKPIEHQLGDVLLNTTWASGVGNIEISKSDLGSQSHDYVADESSILHHLQLNTAKLISKVYVYIQAYY